ncbi:MAG TPA: inositol-1-monophosphatase [Moraxellaceae bacterium]|nr:inositol-1-monophosphatase [Moraxellaceae bacterium]
MQPMLNMALRAARAAGEIIYQSAERVDLVDIEAKGYNDYVTKVDRAAERAILDVLQKTYPDHGFLAEETGRRDGKGEGADWLWIIDPLDGTTNFVHGLPQFAVSIAVQHKGVTEHAVVLDPMRREEFTASRGRGAAMNGRRLRVTARKGLEGALIGTGFPFRPDQMDHIDAYLGMFKAIASQTAGIRRPGAAALDLAYVAAGRFDGFFEFGLSPWDMAAGDLLIRESGGLVCDFTGGHRYLESGNIVAGNPKVLKALLTTLAPHLEGTLRR